MKVSWGTIAKYAGGAIHYLGPTVTIAIIALVGFGVLSAKLERQQKQLYASTQNEVAQFKTIADGIAQAKVKVIEKHELKTTVKELPPEVRAELKELRAKVEALLKAQVVIPSHSGSGNATHEKPLEWTYDKPDYLSIKFTLKLPQSANFDAIQDADGTFDYTIAPVPVELTMTKGVFARDGVDGLQQWFITAKDMRDDSPIAVKDFDVKIPNLYQKRHWWQKWYITIPAGVLAGMAVKR
jgi:hypothetical protein